MIMGMPHAHRVWCTDHVHAASGDGFCTTEWGPGGDGGPVIAIAAGEGTVELELWGISNPDKHLTAEAARAIAVALLRAAEIVDDEIRRGARLH